MKENVNKVPSALGINGLIDLIADLSRNGYRCETGGVGSCKWIKMTKKDGFVAYFYSWADVFGFNDSCASVVEAYEKEEAEAADNE